MMHKISQLDLDVFSHLLHLAQCSHIQDMISLRPTLTSSQLLYHTELVELGSDTLYQKLTLHRYLKPNVYMCKYEHVRVCLIMSVHGYVF